MQRKLPNWMKSKAHANGMQIDMFSVVKTILLPLVLVGFDIGSVIIAAVQEKILIKGGGHKMAGGFTIKTENVEKFKKFILKKFERLNNSKMNIKPLYLDSIIAPTALNLQFYNKVNSLAPFGSGNP